MTPAEATREATDRARRDDVSTALYAHRAKCHAHVREAIAQAARRGHLSVKVSPPPLENLWAWALGYTPKWADVKELMAGLRAEGYAVRVRGTLSDEVEISWAPMAPCKAKLWTWGVL